ncbi:DUF3823 domain-containing protein [Marinoscillum sp.]|uniref:DUF3823 domain-containing protein n=1 Tax=Marinoscillum sp. TaxID=2024838 RepID=UPI003BAB68BE
MNSIINIKRFIILGIVLTLFSACELDNFDGPDSGLYGRILDEETGELVPQDIINGTLIEIWEDGYDPVTPQRLEVKNDGTYKDTRLFANTYSVIPVNTNFHNNATIGIDTARVTISGQTEFDLKVTPYVRIVDFDLTQSGTKVVARFKLEQPIDSVYLAEGDVDKTAVIIDEVSLFVHFDPNVGREMSLGKTTESIGAIIEAGVNDEYRLDFDTSKDTDFVNGGKIYMRVGAIAEMPQARTNYGPTIELDF